MHAHAFVPFLSTFSEFFRDNPYMPHGACFLWQTPLLAAHAAADGVIALAYYSIPFSLLYFVNRRHDLSFKWIFLMFALFIFGCATTHVMDIWTLWFPNYWTSTAIRVFTAVVSIGTAVALWRLIPHALALASPAQLRAANDALRVEVAERRRAEAELQRVNAELQQRRAELEALTTELEAFSYSVSHDLRAPLRRVAGFSGALAEELGSATRGATRHLLDRIVSNVERMNGLIDALLEFSSVARSSLGRESIDLANIARPIVAELQEREPERQVEALIAEQLPASGDAKLLSIVMENLLNNAWKYTRDREPARIEVGMTQTAGVQVYYVRDNGAGFPAHLNNRLFIPFQRLHSDQEFEGSGVGLATVQRIIHRHGGRIWAEGDVDRGATFFFTLGS